MMTALAVALFIVGLINLFLKDLIWQLTFSGSVIEGLPAERNEQWDLWMNISGVAALLLGLFFWFYM
ncbi:MAG: hypothetical protein DCC55_37800 [Chloroflexi bacterium]|nr:MAG: hypothetical protein DCC55_37800 [Chloroflexota bacterium]